MIGGAASPQHQWASRPWNMESGEIKFINKNTAIPIRNEKRNT